MRAVLLVALGGAVGASSRHLLNLLFLRFAGANFPWGTLAINVTGSLAMGLLIGWLSTRSGASQELRLFAATGVLGGFTTFSAFSLETALLWERGQPAAAGLYVAASVSLSLLGLVAGLWLARSFA